MAVRLLLEDGSLLLKEDGDALLLELQPAQYWHPTYWHPTYWQPNYWGGTVAGAPAGSYWGTGYWKPGYWETGYWAEIVGSGNSLGAINVTLSPFTAVFTGVQVEYFDITVTVGPTWTATAYGVFGGTIAATLADNTSVLLGTFTAENANLGTIATTLANATGALSGTHAAPGSRAGTIVSTLADFQSSLTATIAPAVTGTIGQVLDGLTSNIRGQLYPAGTAVASWYTTLEDTQADFNGSAEVPEGFFVEAGPQNPNAVFIPSNYEICDRTGFRVERGGLRKEWTGLMVRPESWEPRHPLDFVRGRPERAKGSPRPEQTDRYIADTEQVSADDL